MRLEDTPYWNDPLVHDTICRLQGRWENSHLSFINNRDVLQALMETDALDAVSAAALVAEAMAGGADRKEVIPFLAEPVAAAYDIPVFDVLNGPGGTAPFFVPGNPAVLKIALATIVANSTGEALADALDSFDDEDQQRVNTQVGPALVDLTRRLIENQSWKDLPQKLSDRYAEGIANVIEQITDPALAKELRTSLRIYQQTSEEERERERSEKARPQLPEDCAYNRLKSAAKKFKL